MLFVFVMSSVDRTFGSLFLAFVGLGTPTCKSTQQDCTPGTESCACVDGQCFGGWPCHEGICVAPNDESASTGAMASTIGESSSDAEPGAGPTITNLFADVQTFAPGTIVTFTATVSHPDGLSEIVGGTLQDPDTEAVYGAFTQSAGGTYVFGVSWDQVNAVAPVSGPRDGPVSFEAVFQDNDGRSAREGVDLSLSCNGQDACSGTCVNWSTDDSNCGGCNTVCGQGAACLNGSCEVVAWSPCFRPDDMTCAQACNQLRQTCVANSCNGSTYAYFWDLDACLSETDPTYKQTTCNQLYHYDGAGFIDPEGAVRCCCA